MRILVLTNLYPNPYQPHRGAFNRQQVRALATQHEVQVIAPIAWTGEWAARRKSAVRLSGDRKRLCDGMIVNHPRYVFTPKILRGWYGQFFLRSVGPCFERVVREFRPEVVLGCWAYPDGWAAVRLARDSNLPVAIKVHGSDVLMLQKHPRRLQPTAEALRGADATIAVSRDLARRVASMGVTDDRLHVVYNGLDTELFRPGSKHDARARLGISGDRPAMLFVGNLVAVKGLDVLVEACAKLLRGGTLINCFLVGEGPLKGELQAKVAKHALDGHVHFVGARPLEQLPQWYQAADLLVLPSRSEGVPNVLLEAMACGTPFVATRVGGIAEIAEECSLIAPDDADALAEKIGKVLAAGSAAPTSKFRPVSWNDSATALAEVLRRVVSHSTLNAARVG